MAEVHVQSDGEDDDISATGKSSNCSLESEDDSLLGFEDDLEEDDEEFDIGEPSTSNETTKTNGEVPAKRKRKQVDPSKRKRIRRILREDELTEGTISAQKEERERLRRLELQRSLAAAGSSSLPTSKVVENLRSESPSSNSSKPSSPVAVDVREKKDIEPHIIVIDSDDESDSVSHSSTVNYCDSHKAAENLNGDLIEIISSDSEVELGESDDDDDDDSSGSLNACKRSDVDYDNSGLHTDDNVNQVDPQGRVLVNVNHPLDEEDIFLAPQIAKVIKAHQV